jgi:predicted nucleic acid-binding protein
MIVDTDVLVWYLRGDKRARDRLRRMRAFSISAVTHMELIQGMRDRGEMELLKGFLRSWGVTVVGISEKMSDRAVFYMEQHFLGHSLRMADALIGATAWVLGEPLLTGNVRHYRVLKDVKLVKFRR